MKAEGLEYFGACCFKQETKQVWQPDEVFYLKYLSYWVVSLWVPSNAMQY